MFTTLYAGIRRSQTHTYARSLKKMCYRNGIENRGISMEISGCFDEMWACQDPELPYRELRFKMKALELIQLVWQFSAGKVTAPPGKTFRLYENKLKIALAYIQEPGC